VLVGLQKKWEEVELGAVSVVVDNGSVGGEQLLTAISEVAS